jgi:hypothetical protein
MELSQLQIDALGERGVGEDAVDVVAVMLEAIEAAAEDVAADTRKASFDDATSRGGLLYRRARNRIMAAGKDQPRVTIDTTDNGLHVRVGGLAVSFYAARNGLEFPSLSGSKTKDRVVSEMQMSLPGMEQISRLIVMHESDPDGLIRAAVGVLASSTRWEWSVMLFDRFAADIERNIAATSPSYGEQPEAELPPIERRRIDDGKVQDQ